MRNKVTTLLLTVFLMTGCLSDTTEFVVFEDMLSKTAMCLSRIGGSATTEEIERHIEKKVYRDIEILEHITFPTTEACIEHFNNYEFK